MVCDFFAEQSVCGEDRNAAGQHNLAISRRPCRIFGTRLLITPHGPDFEYVATSGRLKMALLPDLDLRRAHLLITKTLLTIYDIDLASNSGSAESIRAQAKAGIGKDKSVDLKANFN